jgi:hypothetical protein
MAATEFGNAFAADDFPEFFGFLERVFFMIAFFAARDFVDLEVPILRTI